MLKDRLTLCDRLVLNELLTLCDWLVLKDPLILCDRLILVLSEAELYRPTSILVKLLSLTVTLAFPEVLKYELPTTVYPTGGITVIV